MAFHILLGLFLLLSLPGQLLANRGTVFVAHRGGIVEGFPENTVAAFEQAIAQGVDAIEIDLRGTKDGEVVIVHDETLERTTDGRGRVIDHTLAELRRLDAGGGQRIPTYEEVLRLVADTRVKLLLDIKESPHLDKARVVHLTEQHGAVLDVIVGVRSIGDLREFRRLNPNLRTLGFVRSPDDMEAFAQAGVDIIRLWPRWVEADPDIIARVHRLGLPVWCTTGTASRVELERLIHLGVNGVLTDFPKLVGVLRAR